MTKTFSRFTLLFLAGFLAVPAFAQGGTALGIDVTTGEAVILQIGPDGQVINSSIPNTDGAVFLEAGPDGQIKVNGTDLQQLQQTQQPGVDPQNVQRKILNTILNPSNNQLPLADQLSQLQNRLQNIDLDSLKQQLEVTDQEWAVLLPKIQKVITARNNAPSSSNNMSISRMMNMGAGQVQTPFQKTDSDLRNLVNDPNSSNSTLAQKLKDYRAAADQAVKELRAAEKDLSELLTPRQEGILVNLGFMK